MAYGSPDSLKDVAPYLEDIRGGRPISERFLKEICERYNRIGGRSPLRDITEQQACALKAELVKRGLDVVVVVGMRHWHPRIQQAVKILAACEVTDAVAIALVPHYSTHSVGAYQTQVRKTASSEIASPRFKFVSHFGDHPSFIAAVGDNLKHTLQLLDNPRCSSVIFTAHSLPKSWVDDTDPYLTQLHESAQSVAQHVGLRSTQWQLCFQSAGARPGEWLGPSVDTTLHELAREGIKEATVVPFGFVSDHVEILFDIDIQLKEYADSLGVRLYRPPSLGSNPQLITALADRVQDVMAIP